MSLDIVLVAGWIGSVAFALSGYLVATRKGLDAMGVFIVAMLTANGGGAVRDVLIGRVPLVLQSDTPFLLTLGVIFAAWAFKLGRAPTLEQRTLFVLCDAVGLVAFALTGASAGITAGLPIFGVMVLAFLTAAGGGILRDVMLREVPAILSSDFYGTVAIALAMGLYALHAFAMDSQIAISLLFGAALALRILAYFRGWRLPRLH